MILGGVEGCIRWCLRDGTFWNDTIVKIGPRYSDGLNSETKLFVVSIELQWICRVLDLELYNVGRVRVYKTRLRVSTI
jgi:hypothetical protein